MKPGTSSLHLGIAIGTSNVAVYVVGPSEDCLIHLTPPMHRDDSKSDTP